MKYLLPIFLILLLASCQNHPSPNQSTSTVLPSVFNPAPFSPPHPEQKPKERVEEIKRDGPDEFNEFKIDNKKTIDVVPNYDELEKKFKAEEEQRQKEVEANPVMEVYEISINWFGNLIIWYWGIAFC